MKEELEEILIYIEKLNISLEEKTKLIVLLTKYINSIKIIISNGAIRNVAAQNVIDYFTKEVLGRF